MREEKEKTLHTGSRFHKGEREKKKKEGRNSCQLPLRKKGVPGTRDD